MKNKFFVLQSSSLSIILAFLTAGCVSFDASKVRKDQTQQFSKSLEWSAEDYLVRPLSLEDCIRIAMENNYQVRLTDLQVELARLGKNVAFSSFLPSVTATAGYSSYSKDPQITDRNSTHGTLDLAMPIFMPSTWFLYAAQKHQYASAKLAGFYVRQSIVMQTSVQYFNCLVQEETIAAIESQLAATQEAAGRISAHVAEGFFTKWEGDLAQYQANARQVELNQAKRQLDVVRGELLTGMGLSPQANIVLSKEIGEVSDLDQPISDLVLTALEIHPELSMADRNVVITQNQVRQAFTAFIPTLSIYSSGAWTSDDLALHSMNWLSGFSGVWNIFTGFANVANYKASKVNRQSAELERESTFLTIMLQVINAEASLRNSSETTAILEQAFHVYRQKYDDYYAKSQEGLVSLSDALDARAEMDLSQMAWVRSRYNDRIAHANLLLAMGMTDVPSDAFDSQSDLQETE